MHSSSIANALNAPPGGQKVAATLTPLRNPISTWDTEYTWQRAGNPLFAGAASAAAGTPHEMVLVPVATGSGKAPIFVARHGPFNNAVATYPSHVRREQGPEGAPPFAYREPRTPWGRGRPFAPAFAPAFKGDQSVSSIAALANAASGVSGQAADRHNALTMDLSMDLGSAPSARAAMGIAIPRDNHDAISPGSGASPRPASARRPASAHPSTSARPAAAAASLLRGRAEIALSRAPVNGMAESALYPAGYPQRLRGDSRGERGGGATPAMATLSYHATGRTRRFGAPQAWLTSYMEMNIGAHGTAAFK